MKIFAIVFCISTITNGGSFAGDATGHDACLECLEDIGERIQYVETRIKKSPHKKKLITQYRSAQREYNRLFVQLNSSKGLSEALVDQAMSKVSDLEECVADIEAVSGGRDWWDTGVCEF